MSTIRLMAKGVAYKVEDIIYVHYRLLNYFPKAYKEILAHEKQHTDKVLSWKDIKLDLFNPFPVKSTEACAEFIRFMMTTPSAWWQISPVIKRGDVLSYDVFRIISYIIFISITTSLVILWT